MILVLGVLVSLVVSLVRTRGDLSGLARLRLRSPELVFIAFALQIPMLRYPAGGVGRPFPPVSILFLLSCLLLLVFAWRNRHLAGTWMLGLGVTLNMLVMVGNGGFMPISPGTLARLSPGALPDQWQPGYHRQQSKGITLSRPETLLWELSDIFVLPPPFPLPAAFSLGDVFITGGVFLLLQRAMGSSGSREAAGEAHLEPVA
jgi:hypothetical protein